LRPQFEFNMSEVFRQCQEIERKRSDFFQRMLRAYTDIADLSRVHDGEIQRLRNIVGRVDTQADLDLFAQTSGDAMPLYLPVRRIPVISRERWLAVGGKGGSRPTYVAADSRLT
jgi:hypothetical protein